MDISIDSMSSSAKNIIIIFLFILMIFPGGYYTCTRKYENPTPHSIPLVPGKYVVGDV